MNKNIFGLSVAVGYGWVSGCWYVRLGAMERVMVVVVVVVVGGGGGGDGGGGGSGGGSGSSRFNFQQNTIKQ